MVPPQNKKYSGVIPPNRDTLVGYTAMTAFSYHSSKFNKADTKGSCHFQKEEGEKEFIHIGMRRKHMGMFIRLFICRC
jgi:hypothetical protein